MPKRKTSKDADMERDLEILGNLKKGVDTLEEIISSKIHKDGKGIIVNGVDLKDQISRVKNELNDFKEIIDKRKAYTQEEVANFVKLTNELTQNINQYREMTIKEQKALPKSERSGTEVIRDHREGIIKSGASVETYIKSVENLYAGYEPPAADKFKTACSKLQKSITSYFKAAFNFSFGKKETPMFDSMKEKSSTPTQGKVAEGAQKEAIKSKQEKTAEDETKPQIFQRKKKWFNP